MSNCKDDEIQIEPTSTLFEDINTNNELIAKLFDIQEFNTECVTKEQIVILIAQKLVKRELVKDNNESIDVAKQLVDMINNQTEYTKRLTELYKMKSMLNEALQQNKCAEDEIYNKDTNKCESTKIPQLEEIEKISTAVQKCKEGEIYNKLAQECQKIEDILSQCSKFTGQDMCPTPPCYFENDQCITKTIVVKQPQVVEQQLQIENPQQEIQVEEQPQVEKEEIKVEEQQPEVEQEEIKVEEIIEPEQKEEIEPKQQEVEELGVLLPSTSLAEKKEEEQIPSAPPMETEEQIKEQIPSAPPMETEKITSLPPSIDNELPVQLPPSSLVIVSGIPNNNFQPIRLSLTGTPELTIQNVRESVAKDIGISPQSLGFKYPAFGKVVTVKTWNQLAKNVIPSGKSILTAYLINEVSVIIVDKKTESQIEATMQPETTLGSVKKCILFHWKVPTEQQILHVLSGPEMIAKVGKYPTNNCVLELPTPLDQSQCPVIDPVTKKPKDTIFDDIIPDQDLIKIRCNGKLHCYNINTIKQWQQTKETAGEVIFDPETKIPFASTLKKYISGQQQQQNDDDNTTLGQVALDDNLVMIELTRTMTPSVGPLAVGTKQPTITGCNEKQTENIECLNQMMELTNLSENEIISWFAKLKRKGIDLNNECKNMPVVLETCEKNIAQLQLNKEQLRTYVGKLVKQGFSTDDMIKQCQKSGDEFLANMIPLIAADEQPEDKLAAQQNHLSWNDRLKNWLDKNSTKNDNKEFTKLFPGLQPLKQLPTYNVPLKPLPTFNNLPPQLNKLPPFPYKQQPQQQLPYKQQQPQQPGFFDRLKNWFSAPSTVKQQQQAPIFKPQAPIFKLPQLPQQQKQRFLDLIGQEPTATQRARDIVTTLERKTLQEMIENIGNLIGLVGADTAVKLMDHTKKQVLDELDKMCLKRGWALFDEVAGHCVPLIENQAEQVEQAQPLPQLIQPQLPPSQFPFDMENNKSNMF